MTKLFNYVLAPSDTQDIDGFQSKLSRAKVLLKQFEDVEHSLFEIDPDHESVMIDFSEQFYVVENVSAPAAERTQTVNAHAELETNSILPTALVRVRDQNGFEHDCGILLDSGSMSTFISEKMCNVLRLPRRKNCTVVTGISGSGNQVTKGSITLTLKS